MGSHTEFVSTKYLISCDCQSECITRCCCGIAQVMVVTGTTFYINQTLTVIKIIPVYIYNRIKKSKRVSLLFFKKIDECIGNVAREGSSLSEATSKRIHFIESVKLSYETNSNRIIYLSK